MPNDPLSSDIHHSFGPLVRVRVGEPEPHRRFILRSAWANPLPEIPTRFLVDTGAANTFLDKAVIDRLRLRRRGVTKIYLPGEREWRLIDTFVISLQLVGNNGKTFDFKVWEVCSLDFPGRDYQGLLGRDMLKNGSLSYQGRHKKFFLEF